MDVYLFLPVSFVFGIFAFYLVQRIRLGAFEQLAQNIIETAEKRAIEIKRETEVKLKELQIEKARDWELFCQIEKKKMHKEEERLKEREDKLEGRYHSFEKKWLEIEKKESQQTALNKKLEIEIQTNEELQKQLTSSLEKICGLSSAAAREWLLESIQNEIRLDTARFIKRSSQEASAAAEQESARIISTAMNRMASSIAAEITTCTVSLPSEDMKGRIIGREGRNIRALEKACGVNFLLDDTPHAVVISSFDPVRRQIAKNALTELLLDGRIHPTRIEEAVEKSSKHIQKLIVQHGEDAAMRIGAINLHPELIKLLGKLKFRYSLGQNILDHSLEVAHLMGIMAQELNLDHQRAKRIGLLHDIGKAVSHEIQGSHASIGHDLASKYGETIEIANGIGCHHFEIDPISIEGSLCSAADAISASRPGARIEAAEEYIHRLQKLEALALTFQGVEKAYALQAGREVRVIALPDQLKDEDLIHLARNLTKRIETELDYPGKIKVTLLREKRVIDYAM